MLCTTVKTIEATVTPTSISLFFSALTSRRFTHISLNFGEYKGYSRGSPSPSFPLERVLRGSRSSQGPSASEIGEYGGD